MHRDPDLKKDIINFYKNSGLEIVTKHIPGHGCTNIDSHYHLPKVNFSLEYLKKNDSKVMSMHSWTQM